MLDNIRSSLGGNQLHHGRPETYNDDLEEEKSDADKAEAENHTTVEGSNEAFVLALTAEIGNSHIGVGCNLHADKARNHGGEGTHQEGNCCEGGAYWCAPRLIHSDEDDGSEEYDEDAEVQVFLFEESVGSLSEKL